MNSTLHKLTLVAGIGLLFSGCTGPEGPQGPVGTQGPAGVAGPSGPTGANGNNGVANINIAVYSVSAGSWNQNPSPVYYFQDFIDAAITDSVQDNVSVFFSLKPKGPWQALPAINAFSAGDQITYTWSVGNVFPIYDFSTAPASTLYFDVIVIPPAIMKQHPNINWKDGNAVLKMPEVQAAMPAAIKN